MYSWKDNHQIVHYAYPLETEEGRGRGFSIEVQGRKLCAPRCQDNYHWFNGIYIIVYVVFTYIQYNCAYSYWTGQLI